MRIARVAAATGLAIALTACGPLITLPGGALSGTPKPVPSDWSFSDAVETVQLETRLDDPYSVNIWGVGVGPVFYVASGKKSNQWALNIDADPRVRLRIGEDLYDLRATPTEDPAELDLFLAAAQKKYDFEPDPEQRANATLFRLEPR